MIKAILNRILGRVRASERSRENESIDKARFTEVSAPSTTREPETKPNRTLEEWLKEHYDGMMDLKESLHHEGTGRRTSDEWEEARNYFKTEQDILVSKRKAKKYAVVEQWIGEGISEEEALVRWKK